MNYTTPLHLDSKAALVNAIKNRRYIIGSMDTVGNVSFSKNPATHNDAMAARAECRRLSKLSPGKLYFYTTIQGGEEVPMVINPFSY